YRDRILFCPGYIDQSAANNLVAILLYLENSDPAKPVTLYMNIPGGDLRPSLAVADTMRSLRSKGMRINTLNLGFTAGLGAFLLSLGSPGCRLAMPNSRMLLHRSGSYNGEIRGQCADVANDVREIVRANEAVERDLAKVTGQPVSRVRKDMERRFYVDAGEAKEYG
ncbi:hypothetical protein TeGR_g3019, partial [Tetraparma gracilis]